MATSHPGADLKRAGLADTEQTLFTRVRGMIFSGIELPFVAFSEVRTALSNTYEHRPGPATYERGELRLAADGNYRDFHCFLIISGGSVAPHGGLLGRWNRGYGLPEGTCRVHNTKFCRATVARRVVALRGWMLRTADPARVPLLEA